MIGSTSMEDIIKKHYKMQYDRCVKEINYETYSGPLFIRKLKFENTLRNKCVGRLDETKKYKVGTVFEPLICFHPYKYIITKIGRKYIHARKICMEYEEKNGYSFYIKDINLDTTYSRKDMKFKRNGLRAE